MNEGQILITTIIVGIVQLVNFVKAKAWDSVVTIIAAAIVGAVVGLAGIGGLTVVTGILAGFGAVGIVTVAQAVGGTK